MNQNSIDCILKNFLKEKNVQSIKTNVSNRDLLVDEIKSADNNNYKIVKTISIKRCDNSAQLVYLRDFSFTYKKNTQDNMSDVERFNYNVNGIPEEDYPVDKLDEAIMNAVRLQFPEAKMRSKLLACSEIDNIKSQYNRFTKKAYFTIHPDLKSCSMLPNKFPLKRFETDVFIDNYKRQICNDLYFDIIINLDNVNDYYDFVDGLKTLCSMKRFLGIN